MKTERLRSIAAATLGLLSGPLAGPFIADRIPDVGWLPLVIIFSGCLLVPPLVLLYQAAGGQYLAMVRTWSALFLFAVFVAAAGASALVVSAATAAVEPASLVFVAAGLGLIASLSGIKLMLLRKRATKDA
jgi:hypothetical protein